MRNVVVTGNTIVHLKIVVIHFILNSFLTKHNKHLPFVSVPCSKLLKIIFLQLLLIFISLYNYIKVSIPIKTCKMVQFSSKVGCALFNENW